MIRIDAGVVFMLSMMCLVAPSMVSAGTQDETDPSQGVAEKTDTPPSELAPSSTMAADTHTGEPQSTEEGAKGAEKEDGQATTQETVSSQTAAPQSEQAKSDSDPEEKDEAPSELSVMDTVVLPLMTTGAGAGSALIGLGIGLWGLRPLMQFYQLQAVLQAEESRASTDPIGATQNAFVFQAMAYERNREWKMFGLPMVVGGTLLTLGGTVFIGSGVTGLAWGWNGESE
jgi:hypothetical protein